MKKSILILFILFVACNLYSQDYQISFSGSGESSVVESVTIENITQGKNFTISGTDTLHLLASVTGIDPFQINSDSPLIIYPNPSTNYCTLEFGVNKTGTVAIRIYDLLGREMTCSVQPLTIGIHSFRLSGLRSGIYMVKVDLEDKSYAKKVIIHNLSGSKLNITYTGNIRNTEEISKLKSNAEDKYWQYNTGDRLKFLGVSGKYSTIVVDIPTQNKTIPFNFVECTDADGNNYPTVQIGTQIWMVENLKTTKYRNGEPLTNITNDTLWDSSSSLNRGGYCWYDNDTVNKNIYGGLYQYTTINDSLNISPVGWHVPTLLEWTTLSNFFQGYNVGEKLKETGTTHWLSANVNATNESGFSAFPGGYRYNGFFDLGKIGYWWSSMENSTLNAYSKLLLKDVSSFNTGNFNKQYGFSVRCLKGELPLLNTLSATNVTSNSFSSGGSIKVEEGTIITEKGLCWSTEQNPDVSDSKIKNGSGSNSFTSEITGLKPNTTYYVRAYLTNVAGTFYGNQITVKTLPLLPSVSTSLISLTDPYSVTVQGDITNPGGAFITERGFCWSTTQTPTIDDDKTTNGYDSGIFKSEISGLNPNTKYFIRAYAKNSDGISYGNTIIFNTLPIYTGLSLRLENDSIKMGSSSKVLCQLVDENGSKYDVDNTNILWESTDNKIASIDKSGLISTDYDGIVFIKAKIGNLSDSIKLNVLPDFNNWKAFFEPVPNAFPDLNSYFKETSGSAFLTVLTRVDLNKDGRTDLVFHLYHFRNDDDNLTIPYDAPVPNRLVALVSQNDGTFVDQTAQLFGRSDVDLAGGASRKVRVADFNNDGFPDWVYALNREEGRPLAYDYWNNQSIAVISNGNGTYQTIVFGEKKYHHSVEILPMFDGSIHVLFDNDEEYLFSNSTFIKVASSPIRDPGTYLVYSSQMNSIPNFLFTGFNPMNNTPNQLKLFKRTDDQNWVEESVFKWQDYRQIDYVDYTNGISKNNVISSNGKEYIAGGYFESVALRLYPTATPTPIVHFATSYVTNGTQGKTLIYQNDCPSWSKLMAFESKNGILQEVNIISDPEGPYNINFMDAIDVNKDGYDDLITYPYIEGAKPRVYLNNQAGMLVLLNQNKLPETNVKGNYNSAFVDVDGDGIDDLVFFPGNGCSCDNSCTTFLLYKGRRNLQ